jgi:hypothetical protein
MGILEWFTGSNKVSDKIADSNTLLLFDEMCYKDCYGAEERVFKRVTNLDTLVGHVGQDNDPSRHHLIASCSLNGRHIPMLDCDHVEALKSAKARFEAKQVRHAVIESSPGHFWLFPDMSFCDFWSAWEATSHLPGCDKKYLKFSKDRAVYFVRAEPRDIDTIPEFVHNDCEEPNVTSFLKQFMALFQDRRIHAIVQIKPKKKRRYA